MDHARDATGWGYAIGLLCVTAAGFALRVYRLGELGFSGNEDYLVLSVRGILHGGLPVFPSGVLYPRALPQSYLTALLVQFTTFNEFYLRLPSVLLSTASVPLVGCFGRRLFNPAVGLVAAALLAVSDWDVEMARIARMYSPLAFLVLLTMFLFYLAVTKAAATAETGAAETGTTETGATESGSGRLWTRIGTVLCILLTCSLHRVAVVLVPMFGCLVVFGLRRGWRPHFGILCAAVSMVGFVCNLQFEKCHYGQWEQLVVERVGAPETPEKTTADRIRERVLPLFLSVQRDYRGAFVLGAGGLVMALIVAAGAAARRRSLRLFSLAVASVLVALFFQQSLISMALLGGYFLAGRWLEAESYRFRSLVLLGCVGVGTLLWIGYAVFHPDAFPYTDVKGWTGALEAGLKTVQFYPRNFAWMFCEKYPLLSVFAAVAIVFAVRRYVASTEISEGALVLLLFACPLAVVGVTPVSLLRFYPRYVHFLCPFFYLLVACGLVGAIDLLRGVLRDRGYGLTVRRGAIGALVVVVTVVSQGGGAWRSTAVVTAGYGVNAKLFDRRTDGHPFHPDNQGAALFVKSEYRDRDVVVAMDILAFYSYFERVDYQVTLSSKRDAEGWIGVPTLSSAVELEELLRRSQDRRVWVALSGYLCRYFADHPDLQPILDLLAERGGRPAYRGRDGLSDVYLVQSGGP